MVAVAWLVLLQSSTQTHQMVACYKTVTPARIWSGLTTTGDPWEEEGGLQPRKCLWGDGGVLGQAMFCPSLLKAGLNACQTVHTSQQPCHKQAWAQRTAVSIWFLFSLMFVNMCACVHTGGENQSKYTDTQVSSQPPSVEQGIMGRRTQKHFHAVHTAPHSWSVFPKKP